MLTKQFKDDNAVFRQKTGVPLHADMLMTMIAKKPIIDIVKIDDELKRRHGNYEDGKTSMSGFLLQKFGKDTVKIIERYL